MSDAQPHVGDYWRRIKDRVRIQVTRVWLKPGDPDPGVAYDIFGTLNGRPSKSTSAVHLSRFLEWFTPENPAQALTEDRVRKVVRQELTAALAVLEKELREEACDVRVDGGSAVVARGHDALAEVLDKAIRKLAAAPVTDEVPAGSPSGMSAVSDPDPFADHWNLKNT